MTALRRVPGAVGDTTLIEQSRHDPERFAILYDRYFEDVHRYIAGRLGREIADDLGAETFLIAFRKRSAFDSARGAVRPWLYGIATHLVTEHRRKESRRLNAFSRVPAEFATDGHEDRVAARITAEGTRPELARAIKGLSRRDRDVLFLIALAGLSYDEVAQALGIPAGTVGSRLNRARRRLRQELGTTDPTEES